MNITRTFAKELDEAMCALEENEWAVTEARERIINGSTPHEAFENVVGVLHLAAEQSDIYAFSSCCWLALSLAEVSGTTERPKFFNNAIINVINTAGKLNAESEAEALLRWYRYDT